MKGKIEESLRPPLGEIRVIIGGSSKGQSSKSKKAYLKVVQSVQLSGRSPRAKTKDEQAITFMDYSSSYTVIIGRPTLNSWKAVTSTYHLSVKFPIEHGVGQVQGDQLAARECYLAMLAMDEQVQTLNIEEKRVVAEPTEASVDISLDESNPKRCTKVGVDQERKIKEDLVQFLKKNIDVFA